MRGSRWNVAAAVLNATGAAFVIGAVVIEYRAEPTNLLRLLMIVGLLFMLGGITWIITAAASAGEAGWNLVAALFCAIGGALATAGAVLDVSVLIIYAAA